ncbi:MAG: CAP domain-containing protein [Pseudomonadota bacterium]
MLSLAIASLAAAQSDSSEHVWLQAHNTERAEFGAPDLVWSEQLEQEARDWANRIAREGRMRHASLDQRKGRGENLWMGSAGYFPPDAMIDAFNSEERYFKSGTFPEISRTGNWRDAGHYTQVVWPQTREVGCALSSNGKFDFLVCRYWPAGNIYGMEIRPIRQ